MYKKDNRIINLIIKTIELRHLFLVKVILYVTDSLPDLRIKSYLTSGMASKGSIKDTLKYSFYIGSAQRGSKEGAIDGCRVLLTGVLNDSQPYYHKLS